MDEHQNTNAIFHAAMPSPVMTREPEAVAPATEPVVASDASASPQGVATEPAAPRNDMASDTAATSSASAGGFSGFNDGLDDVGDDVQTPSSTKRQDDDAMADAGENKARIVIRALKAIEENLANVIRLLEEDGGSALPAAGAALGATHAALRPLRSMHDDAGSRVIEGVFSGQHMVGSDGKIYSVPPNYASKSKLVEGDMLKLTISGTGSFIYKQIGPIDRKRVVGALGYDQTLGEYFVSAEDKRWSVLKASVTYFKGEPGDEAVVLVPLDAPSKWGAVENIIRKQPLE